MQKLNFFSPVLSFVYRQLTQILRKTASANVRLELEFFPEQTKAAYVVPPFSAISGDGHTPYHPISDTIRHILPAFDFPLWVQSVVECNNNEMKNIIHWRYSTMLNNASCFWSVHDNFILSFSFSNNLENHAFSTWLFTPVSEVNSLFTKGEEMCAWTTLFGCWVEQCIWIDSHFSLRFKDICYSSYQKRKAREEAAYNN